MVIFARAVSLQLALVNLPNRDAGGLHARFLEQARRIMEDGRSRDALGARGALAGRANQEVADGETIRTSAPTVTAAQLRLAGRPRRPRRPWRPRPTSPELAQRRILRRQHLVTGADAARMFTVSMEIQSPIRNVEAMLVDDDQGDVELNGGSARSSRRRSSSRFKSRPVVGSSSSRIFGTIDQRPRQPHPLALAAERLPRRTFCSMPGASSEKSSRLRRSLTRSITSSRERLFLSSGERDVLDDVHGVEQRRVLKHHAEFAANASQLDVAHRHRSTRRRRCAFCRA